MNPLGPSGARNLIRFDMTPAVAAHIEKARASSEPLVLSIGRPQAKAPIDAPARAAQPASVVFDSSVVFGAALPAGGLANTEPASGNGFAVTFDDIGRYSL